MRKAFSMITAIFVILLMATVAALILNISSKSVQTTTMQYKYEQAVLYAKSYTELAIMHATANDSTNGNCAENINGTIGNNVAAGDGYDVQVRISHIGTGLTGNCSGTRILSDSAPNHHIIIDVYVKYHDDSVAAAWTSTGDAPWLTYHRRTLQKL